MLSFFQLIDGGIPGRNTSANTIDLRLLTEPLKIRCSASLGSLSAFVISSTPECRDTDRPEPLKPVQLLPIPNRQR